LPADTGLKLPSLRQWDKATLYLSIAGIVALAWWYLIDMSSGMSNINMSDAAMGSTDMQSHTGLQNWTLQTFWTMFVMWSVMMVGMMVPSAIRTIMIYARIAQQAEGSSRLATLCFITGYLFIWTGFSFLATGIQWWLNQHALLSPMMVSTSSLLGAGLLVAAGIYQLTPIKDACLKHCQSPVAFISQHFKKGYVGASRMGLHHGFYCLGCCWILMALLFVAGVMNLLWILAITLFVLLEKLLPPNLFITKIAGVLMIITGLLLLY